MLCVTIGRAVANAPAALAVASLGCVLLAGSARAATPTLTYDVAGSDTYAVGDADAQSQITYRGTQTLAIRREGGKTFFDASIRYTRVDQGATSSAKATFAAEVSADGEQRDLEDDDPDYLTVLNQPFAVQLDPQTLRDLAHLQAVVPFSFASPLTGSMLHGRLRRAGAGPVDGMQATGVGFDAEGPMSGPLPGRPSLAMSGRIHMRGTAYYRTADAVLLMLDATLTVSGNLANPAQTDRVTIVYRRRIRAGASG